MVRVLSFDSGNTSSKDWLASNVGFWSSSCSIFRVEMLDMIGQMTLK